MTAAGTVIRVLVVDDSAFVRKVVRQMLEAAPGLEVVGAARDGEEALDLVASLRPDVVTCDLIMPRLDGVGFLRAQMGRQPLPILILSSAAQDADRVMEAFQAGAVDLVRKPTALATDDLRTVGVELVDKVRTAAGAKPGRLVEPTAAPRTAVVSRPHRLKADIVVIGISTGGPQALRRFLPVLPADFPIPIAIVLHMPVGYTALFADKLDELCALEVREATQGAVLRPGLVLIAQAGRHLQVRRNSEGKVVAELSMHPMDKLHRPAADVLFRSAAETYGGRVLGVVMTGMGDDGREGAAWIKAKGGTVLTEAENSCVIYGMPRSVVEAGLSDGAVGLDAMAEAITSRT